MEHYLRKLRYKALRGLVLFLASFAMLHVSAANLVQSDFSLDDMLKYNLYDDRTAELVDAHSFRYEQLEIVKGFSFDGKYYAITKIAEGAIGPSTKITDIIIRDGVKEIAPSAFKGCSKLKNIYLSSSLETIDASVFEGCGALVCIYCGAHSVPTLTGGDNFSGIDISEIKVFVPTGCAEEYSAESSPFSNAKQITEKIASKLEQYNPEFILNEEELTFKPGTTQTLHISLDNAERLLGFQCDLYLPEGLSLAVSSDNCYHAVVNSKNHRLDINTVSNGSYRFISYSEIGGKYLQENDLITIEVDVAETYKGGEIWFKQIEATLFDGSEIKGYDKRFMAKVPEVAAEAIVLNKTEFTLRAGQTESLSVTFTPANTTNKNVTWTSSDPSVATVSATGVVTAVTVGTTTITATTANGKTATAKVIVEATPAESVKITLPEKTTLNVGESVTLSATVLPVLTTDKTVTWTTSNSEVASVDSNGKVTTKKAGNVEITATCGTVSDKISLTITNLVKSLSLNSTEFRIEKGRNTQLVATYTPADATPVNLEWSSSDTSVATVDASGLVNCITPGTAIITIKDTKSGCTATCEIIVTDTLYGDADNDGNVAVNDVVMIVNHILEREQTGFVKDRADVNRDGKINIVDVTTTVDMVLAQTPETVSRARAAMNTRSPNDVLVIDKVYSDEPGIAIIPIQLDTDMAYTAMQFDIKLPDNLEVDNFILDAAQGAGHAVMSLKLGENYYRVMIFSSSLSILSTDEMLMEIKVKTKDSRDYLGGGYAELLNGIASTANGKGEAIGDAGVTIEAFSDVYELSETSAVEVMTIAGGVRINSVAGATVNIYNMAGCSVYSDVSTGEDYYPLQQGVYIVVVDGKSHKVMVKP